MENHYYPFAGQVRLKRKASGDAQFETQILAKKVIKDMQKTKSKGFWYLLNESSGVIKADFIPWLVKRRIPQNTEESWPMLIPSPQVLKK